MSLCVFISLCVCVYQCLFLLPLLPVLKFAISAEMMLENLVENPSWDFEVGLWSFWPASE